MWEYDDLPDGVVYDEDMNVLIDSEGFMVYSVYYYEDTNMFRDGDGYPIYNIFDYLTPNQLTVFKYNQSYTLILSPTRFYTEFHYPDE